MIPAIPTITLQSKVEIPQLGFGTWKILPIDIPEAIDGALQSGYRHIDTAQGYGNEQAIGEALSCSGIKREEIFLVSKLDNCNHLPPDVYRSFEQSLTDLKVDYLDLFLIHWPVPLLYDGDFVSTWKALIDLQDKHLVKAIGVSNFEPKHIRQLIQETGQKPDINQIEVHPFFQNNATRAWTIEHGIAVEAWSPLGQGQILQDHRLESLAAKYGKSTAQITLRWHIQHGNIVFPKSSSLTRMRENLEIFDFELSPDEIALLDSCDQGENGRLGPHPERHNAM